MNRVYTCIVVFTVLLWHVISGCTAGIGTPTENSPPETSLFTKTVQVKQNSQVYVSWQGDDRDGLVIGYVFSWNGKDWFFTRKNDSTFSLKVETADTTYGFAVSAVDNSLGNYPAEGSMVTFSDLNANGIHDNNEPFPAFGTAIDLSPARTLFPIKNTAPIIGWGTDTSAKSAAAVALPDTTFTFASFKFFATDLDGDATIASIEWSLNDSSSSAQWKNIPLSSRFFNLTQADGLKVNADNVLYLRATDIGKLQSSIVQYPSKGKTWFVKKPSGSILLIKDSGNSDADAFYSATLQSIANAKFKGTIDVLDINTTRTADAQAKTIPPFISPMFIESLKLYSAIIWYTDKNPSLSLAQQALPDYVRSGGKVLFVTEFPVPLSQESRIALLDFAPIDSISQKEVSNDPLAIRNGTEIIAMQTGGPTYPNLLKEKGSVLVYELYPKVTSKKLYTLPSNPKWIGTPTVGIIDDQRSMVFLHMPLHLLNGEGRAASMIETVLLKEFTL